MTIDREQLVGIAHAERQRLGRMIQYADPDTWEKPSAADGWWNRDVMAHLAAGDTAAAQLVAVAAPDSETPESKTPEPLTPELKTPEPAPPSVPPLVASEPARPAPSAVAAH